MDKDKRKQSESGSATVPAENTDDLSKKILGSIQNKFTGDATAKWIVNLDNLPDIAAATPASPALPESKPYSGSFTTLAGVDKLFDDFQRYVFEFEKNRMNLDVRLQIERPKAAKIAQQGFKSPLTDAPVICQGHIASGNFALVINGYQDSIRAYMIPIAHLVGFSVSTGDFAPHMRMDCFESGGNWNWQISGESVSFDTLATISKILFSNLVFVTRGESDMHDQFELRKSADDTSLFEFQQAAQTGAPQPDAIVASIANNHVAAHPVSSTPGNVNSAGVFVPGGNNNHAAEPAAAESKPVVDMINDDEFEAADSAAPQTVAEAPQILPPEPARFATPEPARFATPEPARFATPEPARFATPEPPPMAAAPEPHRAAPPEPPNIQPVAPKFATPAMTPPKAENEQLRDLFSSGGHQIPAAPVTPESREPFPYTLDEALKMIEEHMSAAYDQFIVSIDHELNFLKQVGMQILQAPDMDAMQKVMQRTIMLKKMRDQASNMAAEWKQSN